MTEDIVARIDEAVGCQQCGKKLREVGPSPDFCSEDCQRKWMAKRAHPLPTLKDDGGRPPIHSAGRTPTVRPVSAERMAEFAEGVVQVGAAIEDLTVTIEVSAEQVAEVIDRCAHVEVDGIPHGWLSRWLWRNR